MSDPGSIPLSLDTELRLHPQRLSLGKTELLTDAITLPFTDIEGKLNAYAINSSEAERRQLTANMKSYLGRLNANPLIPISFRLKVLNRFEQELNLFDGEMTAAVLNAHKIAIDMVQSEARKESRYYAPLVEMVGNSVELAVKILQLTLEQYRATPVIATRQFFELARLGLDVAASLDEQLKPKAQLLITAICRHELLRAIDFFSKTVEQQHMITREMEYHINKLQAHYCPQQTQLPASAGITCLLTNMSRPNDPPKFMQEIHGSLPFDALIIPVDSLIQRLNTAVTHIDSLHENRDQQRNELHTEEAMLTTQIGGHAMLDALTTHPQRQQRSNCPNTHVIFEWASTKSFLATVQNRPQQSDTNSSDLQWRLIDSETSGICVERLNSDEKLTDVVGSLVGISWFPDSDQPKIGFVRWIKLSRSGEQRLGIELFRIPVKVVQASIESGSEAMNAKRSWPLLIAPDQGSLTAWFPENRVYRNMVFAIRNGDENIHFKIREIMESGPNYCKCTIVRARTSGSES
ncbi:hypothetical protein F3F96_11270 [Mariprofundus sp. NF]|uniref:hypothetical protein n=1 Tax=Mariprofundus sp. NF TaxID=2608716 RepID=UPI0015A283AD|nr:hypothetical protein [Mariprofundus sp. NF]NWF39716.1 hypothetical protein [Mariprofundus sp. NF]